MATRLHLIEPQDPGADWGLPGWTYHDPDMFAAEMERVIRPSWQFVCHAADVPSPGDWRGLELLGESVIVVHGDDGRLRAFANVCRHRGHRVVQGAAGCARKLVCPYHAWVYELDGRLTGVPDSGDYPTLDKSRFGLPELPLEVWHGLVFIRLSTDGDMPPVAAMMAPFEAEAVPYRFADMRPIGTIAHRPVAVNWKNVGDNYSDALHIRPAHPGLKRLFGHNYTLRSEQWADRLGGPLVAPGKGASWSERLHDRLLPAVPHLDADRQRYWLYFKLWPNTAIDIYPDQMDVMQWLPLTPTTSIIREAAYALPDDRREMRAARYLTNRINRLVSREDKALIESVQQGMASRHFTPGPLGRSEVALRGFNAKLRDLIPECRQPAAPPAGWSNK